MEFIRKILGRASTPSYDEQKTMAREGSRSKRLSLAQSSKTNKEILYYLAENDPEPEIRKAVIENEAMPVHVTPLLAQDTDQDVRMALAGRLVELLPHVSQDEQSQLYAYVVQSLGTLALDEVLKIRKALSSTLKDHAHTPPKIAGQLARDVEREVSEPILRFCAALSDEDLIAILKSHPQSWVVEAVAGRKTVSEDVCEAVIQTADMPGGAALLNNKASRISDTLLQHIVIKAREYTEWQRPIAGRPHLPVSVAAELAEFVDASVRDILMQRPDFDEQATEEIAEIFRRRMDYASAADFDKEPVRERLARVIKEGRLNEETVSDALAMRDRPFVNAAIAEIVGTGVEDVVKIFEMKSPKAIVALSWRAGFSMRMALHLQKEMGCVQPKDLLYPKDGTDYPLTQEEIDFQLDFLGLKAA